jgi:hypothetical protein
MVGESSCSAFGVTVTGLDPVRALCKRLVNDGYDPAAPMKVWRGERPWRWVTAIGNPEQVKLKAKRSDDRAL